MSKLVINNPHGLRHRALPLFGLILLLAATAVLGAGSAKATTVGPSYAHAPNDYPVPGIDYSIASSDLQPPPIDVLKTGPHLADGSIFVAPKITTAGTPGQQGPEIVDNQGRPIWFHQGTALITVYHAVPYDLSPWAAPPTARSSTVSPRRSTSPPAKSSGSGTASITSRSATVTSRSRPTQANRGITSTSTRSIRTRTATC